MASWVEGGLAGVGSRFDSAVTFMECLVCGAPCIFMNAESPTASTRAPCLLSFPVFNLLPYKVFFIAKGYAFGKVPTCNLTISAIHELYNKRSSSIAFIHLYQHNDELIYPSLLRFL